MSGIAPTRQRIKQLLIDNLNLEGMTVESIGDDTPLWGEGLGLDSVDALELMVALEQEYGLRIADDEVDQESLATVARLETFVGQLLSSRDSAAPCKAGSAM